MLRAKGAKKGRKGEKRELWGQAKSAGISGGLSGRAPLVCALGWKLLALRAKACFGHRSWLQVHGRLGSALGNACPNTRAESPIRTPPANDCNARLHPTCSAHESHLQCSGLLGPYRGALPLAGMRPVRWPSCRWGAVVLLRIPHAGSRSTPKPRSQNIM